MVSDNTAPECAEFEQSRFEVTWWAPEYCPCCKKEHSAYRDLVGTEVQLRCGQCHKPLWCAGEIPIIPRELYPPKQSPRRAYPDE